MQPEHIIRVARMRGRQHQPPIPVLGQDVFEDGVCFGEFDVGAIFDYGRGAGPVEVAVGVWGFEGWLAEVGFEGVGDGELFAEPDDAFGLGAAEVVDCEVGGHFG